MPIDNVLIARWQKAYTCFNHKPALKVTYDKGWYYIDHGFTQENYREKQLLKMAITLENRINKPSKIKLED
jgi:hypothetical protein